MLKKIVKGAVIGAAALMIAVPAHALIEVHLFGASAQFKFWTDAAPNFLNDPQSVQGAACLGDVEHAKTTGMTGIFGTGPDWTKRDTGIARGFNCQGTGEDLVISYTTFASVQGPRSAKGNVDDPDGCGDMGERGVPDWDDQDTDGLSVTWGPFPGAVGAVDDLACKDIDIGASDVAGETFGQESHGNELGPLGGAFVNIVVNAEPTTGLDHCRPIVVPFAFFANQSVPTNNLTRLMATSIFSGSVFDWNDFGLTAQEIKVCLRHAGSGTHATLDAEVMRGDASLVKDQSTTPFITPVVYFNKGSSDLMRCIDNLGTGAIGYADADKNGANPDGSQGDWASIKRLMFMGADATADNLRNGVYDFWSAQWLYYRADENPAVKAKIVELCNYASIGANIPASRAGFWAAENDMLVEKSDDFDWPNRK